MQYSGRNHISEPMHNAHSICISVTKQTNKQVILKNAAKEYLIILCAKVENTEVANKHR